MAVSRMAVRTIGGKTQTKVKQKLSGTTEKADVSKKKVSTGVPGLKKVSLTLPDEYSEPVDDFEQYTWLIFGEGKIGKTSLCSEFEDALVLFSEVGGKGLRIKARLVKTWKEFKQYIDLLESDPDAFKTVALDHVDGFYTMCVEHVCAELHVDHPSEASWGSGWDGIDKEFQDQINRLAKTGRGVVFVSHVDERPFEKAGGITVDRLIPSIKKQGRKFIKGFVDITAYYGFFGTKRYLVIEGSDTVDAGHRIKEHFLTSGGEKVIAIPMGKSSEEAYANIRKAFDNEQKTTGDPGRDSTLSDKVAMKKKGR